MQILAMVGGTALVLVAGAVFVLNHLGRGSSLRLNNGLSDEQAQDLNREVDDWLDRYKSDQG